MLDSLSRKQASLNQVKGYMDYQADSSGMCLYVIKSYWQKKPGALKWSAWNFHYGDLHFFCAIVWRDRIRVAR